MFSINRLGELMKHLPRGAFEAAVERHGGNRHCKGFDRYRHLLAMVYAQLSGATSLRTLEIGFNAHPGHHYHLAAGPIRRSTLADANARAKVEIFSETVAVLMGAVQRRVRRDMAPFLKLLDSTSITLKGRGFDAWTFHTRTRHTQGLKLHVLYDPTNEAPEWIRFSPANVNDLTAADPAMALDAGQCYVFDKGYYDYSWWHRIDASGSLFVTRFKTNAGLRTLQVNPLPDDQPHILADEVVQLRYPHTRGGRKHPYRHGLRRIVVQPEGHAKPLVLASNDMDSPASVIAERYKARWDIELFFKWIKQHLSIKAFLGRSERAVKVQILTALIAYLLVVLHRNHHAPGQNLWLHLAELRASLFQRMATEAARLAARQKRRWQREFALAQGKWAF